MFEGQAVYSDVEDAFLHFSDQLQLGVMMKICRLCGLIVRVRVVPRRTVVGDIDRRFDNLSRSHHLSHVNCVSSVYGIYVSGQLSRDVIGCFKSNRWLSRDVIGCWFLRSCCYLLWTLID